MTIIESWKQSCSVLRPSNAKLFLLVTGKAFIGAWRHMFTYFWWLLGLWVMVCGTHAYDYVVNIGLVDSIFDLYLSPFRYILGGVVILMYLVALHPSVRMKDSAYFIETSIPVIRLGFIGFNILLFLYFMNLRHEFFIATMYRTLYVFFVFFFIDAGKNIASFFRCMRHTLTFLLYHAPLILIVQGIYYGNSYLLGLIYQTDINSFNHRAIFALGLHMWNLAVATFVCALCSSLYIRAVYSQTDVYISHK